MVVIMGDTVYCPLCEKQMSRQEVLIHERRAVMYFCRPCEIGIYDFDPAFNKWRDADKKIPCPNCSNNEIKWFVRFMDGFFKGFCPKCKTVLKKDGDVKINKNGSLFIPDDMDQEPIEEPVQISIPLAHLEKKFGKDKIKQFKAKRR